MSTSIKITRENGVIKSIAENNDGISVLFMYMPDSSLPSGFTAEKRIKKISSLDEAEKTGIKQDSTDRYVQALYYHIREAIRINPSIVIYLGLVSKAKVNESIDWVKNSLRE